MQPLVGVRVVARLTEFGAAVTKVEPPAGDPQAASVSEWCSTLLRGQTLVTLDFKDGADRARLDELLAEADLLTASMRPSALRRLGLAGLHRSFPQLSVGEIVGYDGDDTEVPGYDLNYQAGQGILSPPGNAQGADRRRAGRRAGGIGGIGGAYRTDEFWCGPTASRGPGGCGHPDWRRHSVPPHRRAAILGGAFPGYGIYRCADGSRAGFEQAFAAMTIEQLKTKTVRADIPLNEVR